MPTALSGGLVIFLLVSFLVSTVTVKSAPMTTVVPTATPVAISYLPLVLSSRTIPTPPSRANFELGGHIRNEGFPYANVMHYAGMTWAKVAIDYGTEAAPIINAAHSRAFKIQITALGAPSLVSQPNFEQDFARWTAEIAAAGADAI